MKKVTLKDVAKVADVSYATVSRALSMSPEIGEETRDRILKICEEMGYSANAVARSMVMKRTNLIGLVLPSIDNSFMSELAFYSEVTARSFGYNILLSNSYPDLDQELASVKLLVGRQVDGILIIPQSHASYKNIEKYTGQVPTVFLSENLKDLSQSYISVDNRQGTIIGTEYLYGLGHRKILYFGRRSSATHMLRAEGYLAACASLGLTPHILVSRFNRSSVDNGYHLAKKLFSDPLDYTAIFASTDSNALGIFKAAEDAGIRIPQDLSVIGFDNIRTAGLPRINLTTIEQPKQEMAEHAVTMLRNKIENASEGYIHEILAPRLIERSSCQSIPS